MINFTGRSSSKVLRPWNNCYADSGLFTEQPVRNGGNGDFTDPELLDIWLYVHQSLFAFFYWGTAPGLVDS